jgi:hypothetical protein
MELARLNHLILQDRYYVLRYEDLISHTELEMQNIANFLRIKFESVFLEPSSMKREISPSSSIVKTKTVKVMKTEEDRLQRYYKNTSRLEQLILRFFNWDLANYFKYDLEKMDFMKRTDLIRLLKYENPLLYLPNRIWMLRNLPGYSWNAKRHLYHGLIDKFFQGYWVSD